MKSLISIPLTTHPIHQYNFINLGNGNTAQDSFIITKKGNIPVIIDRSSWRYYRKYPIVPYAQNGVIIADLNTLYLAETYM